MARDVVLDYEMAKQLINLCVKAGWLGALAGKELEEIQVESLLSFEQGAKGK